MSAPLIDRLDRLSIDARGAAALGVEAGPLRLRRAWPAAADRLLLEYVTDDGTIVPGQWLADRRELERRVRQTAAACPGDACAPAGADQATVMLQTGGADRRLAPLAAIVARRGARLVAHRPERRAVVRLEDGPQVRFVKVLRPTRAERVAMLSRRLLELDGRPFELPRVLAAGADGTVTFSALAGMSLHDRLAGPSLREDVVALAAALRWLHHARPPADAAVHDGAAEVAVLRLWLGHLETYAPRLASIAGLVATGVMEALLETAPAAALLHRDLHDKQVFIDGAGRIGLLDLDLLAVGEPALDVANLVAHLELRAMQGLCGAIAASEAAEAILEAYDAPPSVAGRLPAYLDSARLRLACVYAFRPPWSGRVPRQMLERIGKPALQAFAIPSPEI